jgi:archaemetzincin
VCPGVDREVITDMTPEILTKLIECLRPLYQEFYRTQARQGLTTHQEPGQTFAQYLQSDPVLPQGQRRIIYIQPLGDFTAGQHRIVALTADFLEHYFNLTVKIQMEIPLSVVPDSARRIHPYWRTQQILTAYVLDAVLIPRLPGDAAVYLAFTASDLWPGQGWNFVFGQASTRQRVGVWSIYRNGNADKSKTEFQLCLLRTIKTAVHETAHMFSLPHCHLTHCVMCFSQHREERDLRPLTLCPECLAKLCWATQADPIERYKKMADFFERHGFHSETLFCKKAYQALL